MHIILDQEDAMRLKRLTCPESAHLETIELEDHPLGILIAGCSRFMPESDPTCSRRCAQLLDRRGRQAFERGDLGDAMLTSARFGDPARGDLEHEVCTAPRRDS